MAKSQSVSSVEQLIRLWYHETARIFYDRLVDDKDKQWFELEMVLNLFIIFHLFLSLLS